ncbi:hypothetical protein B0A48_13548 [Cryoendolithus antarcticus]|uniref:Adhesin domain-containing protein n=1 Tax=Cryoendolithus antarcticus TaxID=1507870 RepID=A0A1V8SPE6_9PEZI|nr:hypothetical protein B0A48_13548 [Cryoendolithus antarcticus]
MANSGRYEDDYASDHDSLYSENNSPSDGYFEQRAFPSENFVENSSVTAESDAKAREAAESRSGESEPGPQSPSSRSSPVSPTRTPQWPRPTEQTPLLDAGPAPPDYAAATAHRRAGSEGSDGSTPSSPTRPQSYGSISSQPETAPHDHEQDRQWPFVARGNPLTSPNFPFGPTGDPRNNPNFPFGPNGDPRNSPDFPFGSRGRPGAPNATPFFPSGQPQSMSSEPPRYSDETDAEHGELRNRRGRRQERRRTWRRRLSKICSSSWLKWVIVVGVIAVVLLTTRTSDGDDHGAIRTPKAPSNSPKPTKPTFPIGDHDDPPQSTLPPHQASLGCPLAHYTSDTTWRFDQMANFSFLEMLEPKVSMKLDVGGTIYIQPASDDQELDIEVTASYATSRMWTVSSLHFNMDNTGMQLQFPNIEKVESWKNDEHNCMDIVVAIRIKAGVEIDNFEVVTANQDVVADKGIFRLFKAGRPTFANIANTTSISAVRGDVDLEYWSSRHTIIETTSGSIHGTYALRDLLLLKSSSGSITTTVEPKEADKDYPAPADFIATSNSGSIHTSFPITSIDLPDRDYRSRIETHSTSISGSYILGSSISFRTSSGSITPTILPYSWSAYASNLHSESSSGSTTLTVLPAYKSSTSSYEKHGHSVHRILSSSGSMHLRYPEEWEGRITGETRSGSLSLHGENIKIDYAGDLPGVGKRVVARNGRGDAHIDFKSVSGSVDLGIGD